MFRGLPRALFIAASPLILANACGSGKGAVGADAGSADAGSSDAGSSDAGGLDAGRPSLEDLVTSGAPAISTAPRPAYGAVLVVNDGEDRFYAVESRRDVEPGPFGLPWRSRFRLAAYDGSVEAWAFEAQVDDVISDAAVHPSGDVTVAVLAHPPERMAYDLVRLGRDGISLGRTTLIEPGTVPPGDYGPSDPRPLFRMKSDYADATVGGWVRLLPDGEGLVAAFLSYVDVPEAHPLRSRLALGLATLQWRPNAYAERWARVVEGPHAAQPSAWAYDELRQRESAVRPFLARDDSTGDLLIGRAWNSHRCSANVAVFAEFTQTECVFGSVGAQENERLPLAVTRFSSAGARRGTKILAPFADAAEQMPFALAARHGQLAVAGSVVRKLPDGSKRTYPDPSGYVDYDGYVAIYDADGGSLLNHDFNLGRGDLLAAMRWTPDGIVAAGSVGWDRWQGGKSISRGADPVIAWLSPDGARAATRVIPMSDGSRHFHLHDVIVLQRSIFAVGFADSPMTHSADGGNDAARTFGPLRIVLGM
jgi:hypothetical protein